MQTFAKERLARVLKYISWTQQFHTWTETKILPRSQESVPRSKESLIRNIDIFEILPRSKESVPQSRVYFQNFTAKSRVRAAKLRVSHSEYRYFRNFTAKSRVRAAKWSLSFGISKFSKFYKSQESVPQSKEFFIRNWIPLFSKFYHEVKSPCREVKSLSLVMSIFSKFYCDVKSPCHEVESIIRDVDIFESLITAKSRVRATMSKIFHSKCRYFCADWIGSDACRVVMQLCHSREQTWRSLLINVKLFFHSTNEKIPLFMKHLSCNLSINTGVESVCSARKTAHTAIDQR